MTALLTLLYNETKKNTEIVCGNVSIELNQSIKFVY